MAARRPARPDPPPRPTEVRVRGRAYERTADPSPLAPRPVVHRSRTVASQVTFGLGGRVACTVLLAAPTALFLVRGTVFWLLAMFGSWPVVAIALRDVWQAVEVTGERPDAGRPFTR